MSKMKRAGFTLAELLTALGILAVIATFTIPKVLVIQNNASYNAGAKEFAGAMSGALQEHRLSGGLSTATRLTELTQYLNYVSVNTTSVGNICGTDFLCSAAGDCLNLHNGGLVHVGNASFQFNDNLAGVNFHYVPDMQTSTNGLQLYIYINGKVRTKGTLEPNTHKNLNNVFADILPNYTCIYVNKIQVTLCIVTLVILSDALSQKK